MSADKSNRKFWERIAFLYTPFIEKKDSAYKTLCKEIEPYLTKDMQVLELACGTGQLTFSLADKADTWTATDFSEKMITLAKDRSVNEKITFSVQDATNLPYAEQSFDAVVIANALHIMPDPEKALSEIVRVLKPRGILFAPTFVYEENIPKKKLWLLEKLGFKTFHKWSSSELSEVVKEKGFEILDLSLLNGSLLPECNLVGRKI